MATLSNRNGCRYVQFQNRAGERKGVPLGRIGKQQGEEVRGHIAILERAMLTGTTPPRKTAEWLAELSETLHAKLAKVGLVESRTRKLTTELEVFCTGYVESRTDISQRSRTNLEQARNALVAFFGAHADLATLTRGQMKDWRRKMLESLSPATVSGHIKKARQIFHDAVDRHLIAENPLTKVKAGSQANEERRVYIPAADVQKVIDACPDAEWRLVFALARFAGFRTPSETFSLRWSDVNFGESRILVTSPKTKRHEGKGTRLIPIFPDLLPHLMAAYEAAEPGAEHVVRHRASQNLRTHADRIIAKAGLKVWEKPFQNMRVSCETDLLTRYPINWVIAWIGHSARVQREHYNTVPDTAYADASESAAPGAAEGSGKVRNGEGATAANQHGNSVEGGSEESCRGYSSLAETAENLKVSETALRWALRRLQLLIPGVRRSDIARLSEAVALARVCAPPHPSSQLSSTDPGEGSASAPLDPGNEVGIGLPSPGGDSAASPHESRPTVGEAAQQRYVATEPACVSRRHYAIVPPRRETVGKSRDAEPSPSSQLSGNSGQKGGPR